MKHITLDPYWKTKFGWSYSTWKAWDGCRRSVFFDKVLGYQRDYPQRTRDRIWEIKKTDFAPQGAFEGAIVHAAIEQGLGQVALGRPLELEPLLRQLSLAIENARKNPKNRIVEALNGVMIPDEFFAEVRTKAEHNLRNFIEIIWPQLQGLQYLEHERFDSFTLDGALIWVKCDFVSRSGANGPVAVTDWKTGSDYESENEKIQLGLYTLWAMNKYKVPASLVSTELIFLPTAKRRVVPGSDQHLTEIVELIRLSRKEILGASQETDFPTNPEPRRCMSCKFLELCEDGQNQNMIEPATGA